MHHSIFDSNDNWHAYQTARQAEGKTQELSTQVQFMRRDIERLLMITEALWTLLKKSNGYTDEQLSALVTEIDLRDGVLDGQVSKKDVYECPACHRPVSGRQPKCLYCGQLLQQNPFAR